MESNCLCGKKLELKSNCCQADMSVDCGIGEGTCHYVCQKCEEACDGVQVECKPEAVKKCTPENHCVCKQTGKCGCACHSNKLDKPNGLAHDTKCCDMMNGFLVKAYPDLKCEQCNGTGWYQYTTRGTPHSKVCEVCCKHDKGYWLLEEHYGDDNGRLCCLAGCGATKEDDGSGIKPLPPQQGEKELPCPHARASWKMCPHCLGINDYSALPETVTTTTADL